MLGDAVTTQRMADLLYRKGVFAMGFCHPVVPEGSARIRAQVTVNHSRQGLAERSGHLRRVRAGAAAQALSERRPQGLVRRTLS